MPADPDGPQSPREIEVAREQAYVSTLYERLDTMRQYAKTRLQKVLLETGGTPQARSERESFSQMYSDDLAKYDAAENGLCFGKIELADDDPRYVGRIGILDEQKDFETLLLDWRAPARAPVLSCDHRRARRGDQATPHPHPRPPGHRPSTTSTSTSTPPARKAPSKAPTVESAPKSALLAALNAARTGHMIDIVETIQSRAGPPSSAPKHKSVLVVQGGPGDREDGDVALHRAAYLLYTYRQQLATGGRADRRTDRPCSSTTSVRCCPRSARPACCCPPSATSIPECGPAARIRCTPVRSRGRLAILDVLRNAVRDRQQVPAQPITLTFDSYTVTLNRKTVTRSRGRARSSRRPHNLARPIFVSGVVDALTDQVVETMGANVVGLSQPAQPRRHRRHPRRVACQPRRAACPSPTCGRNCATRGNSTHLLTSPRQRLAAAAPDLSPEDRDALLRDPTVAGFSPADAPLLDETRGTARCRRHRRTAARPSALARADRGCARCTGHSDRLRTTGPRRRDRSPIYGLRPDRRRASSPNARTYAPG